MRFKATQIFYAILLSWFLFLPIHSFADNVKSLDLSGGGYVYNSNYGFNQSHDYSMCEWVKRNSEGWLWFFGPDGEGLYDHTTYVRLSLQSGSIDWSSSSTGWHYLCVTNDSGLVSLYADGSFVDDKANSPTSQTFTSYFNCSNAGVSCGANYFDEIEIYDRALTSGEIASGYARVCPLTAPYSAIAYYNFDGSSITDATGNFNFSYGGTAPAYSGDLPYVSSCGGGPGPGPGPVTGGWFFGEASTTFAAVTGLDMTSVSDWFKTLSSMVFGVSLSYIGSMIGWLCAIFVFIAAIFVFIKSFKFFRR